MSTYLFDTTRNNKLVVIPDRDGTADVRLEGLPTDVPYLITWAVLTDENAQGT